ncbi:hypothetical protein PTKIN_Ptkin14bG0019800 [Pterospermum kingtungense]
MSSLQKACHFLCCLVFFFLNFQANLSSSSRSHDEASALIQFKSSFTIDESLTWDYDAGINSYAKTDSWKEGTDCCSWDGVTCDIIKGHVIGLDLSCSLLYGSIHSNSTLFHLLHLQKLNLAFNNFNASKISSKFGEFTSLVYLNLSNSYFLGQVPSQVSHLSKLVSLDLSGNYLHTFDKHSFEGLIQNLTELRRLFLGETNMSSINPNVLMNLSSSVSSLSLYGCALRGKFPENIFHMPNLKMLNIGFNENLSLKLPKFNRSSHLKHLDLSDISSIELMDSINNLVSLEHLDLNMAHISGSILGEWGNLSKLKYLDLSRTYLSGRIPTSLGSLSNLYYLDLSYNNLSGRIPTSLGSLSNLYYLDLSYNYLSGQIPTSLGSLSKLNYLDLSYNNLSGQIPTSLGSLSKLNYLDLSYNNLSGQIPTALGSISKLNYLYLSRNSLGGQIPCSFVRNLTHLECLRIQDNQLEGSIPDEVHSFPNLVELDLTGNLLNGTLPSWLYTISSLQRIHLSDNQFSGYIKEFQHNSLKRIELRGNRLQGPIPSSISQLFNLTALWLPSNNLSGMVEVAMFSKLQCLEELDLSSNSLSLNSDSSSADYVLPNLQHLKLSSCNITEFPQFLSGSKGLKVLDLSYNRIYGKIPKWMMDVGKDSLFYLNLSHNSFTDIDQQLPWKEIQYLDLSSNLIHGDLPLLPLETNVFFVSNNSLSGEISSQICNARSVQYLDLSHNYLSGTIPQCFGNLSNSLSLLNLGENKLHGIIPPTFTKDCQLKNLNLNGNQLEGPLPRSIINCRGLEVLDLSNNKINDTFPHWLGGLSQLQALVLRSNQLHGSIHDARSNLSFLKIQIFDVSSNYFTGRLPVRYIKNFKAMVNLTKNATAMRYLGLRFNEYPVIGGYNFYSYSIGTTVKGLEMEVKNIFTMLTSIDLSNNKFEGEIPEVIGNLKSLKGLNLSHNNLHGCIPNSMGNLINLEWLDLSSNKLTGTIPERLVDLTFLSVFNVSRNQLQGQIPQGKQLSTFGNDSYEGNRGLCGFPVSKGCNNSERPPSNLMEEDGSRSNISFGWKVVLIGYGCGVVFGSAMGYVVFQTGKPKWLVALVEDRYRKRRKTSKIGNRRHGGRRI